jgi:VirE N-terminal domain.
MEKSSNNPVRFSFFPKPIKNTIPSARFTLADAYRYITGPMARQATQELRLQPTVKDARTFKAANFDYVTFSGLFSKRSESALITHSGLLCLDFDHLENLEEVRQQLLNDEYLETQLLFTSPSGNGLKWIIEIDLSQASHLDYFLGIQNYLMHEYNLHVDPSGKDICRACFLPHDPNCYINPKQL